MRFLNPPKSFFMKRLLLLIISMLALRSANAQCPGFGQITANDKCIFITWATEPAVIPDSIRLLGPPAVLYNFKSASVTGSAPFQATYRNGASGAGACNASSSDIPINDTIIIYTKDSSNGVKATSCNYVAGVLPLTLIRFEGQTILGANQLTWKVTDVSGFSRFIIEQAHSGTTQFKEAQEIPFRYGVDEYTFSDQQPSAGINYYRLKMIDVDGSFTYSPTIRITNSGLAGNGKMVLFPNPAQERINLSLPDNTLLGTNVLLKAVNGQLLSVIPVTRASDMSVSLEGLLPGLYLLQFADGSVMRFSKSTP